MLNVISAGRTVERQRPRLIGRSVGAVLAGLLAIVLLDNAVDFMLHATVAYPPIGMVMVDPLFMVALAYRAVDGTLGSAIAARLAPRHPLRHALILGGIGVVLSSLGVVATVYGGPEFGPVWYPVSLVIITPFVAWAGGRLGQSWRHRA